MSCRLNRLLSNSYGSTTVERDRRQFVYTAITLSSNVVAAYTHLNELVGNSSGTLLRQPLVVGRLTGCAVGITVDHQLRVVLLSILCDSLYIYEILLGSDVCLVEVEEYRYWSCNEFLHGLSWLLVCKHLLQACVLRVSIVELSVESVDLRLRKSLDSVYIRSLVPSSLAKVEGQTKFCIEVVVVRNPSTVASKLIVAVNIALGANPTQLEMEAYMLAEAECVQDTCREIHAVIVSSHGTANATTGEWNEIPNTIWVVATKHIAQIEQDVLIQEPITIACVFWALTIVPYTLTPDTLELRAKSKTRSEPLTNRYCGTWVRTEALKRAGCKVLTVLLT